jgi:hypothetical protein
MSDHNLAVKANHRSPAEEEAARKAGDFIAEFKKENPDADRPDRDQKD